MKLRNGKVIAERSRCGHKCENYSGLCCKCSDKRPQTSQYIAFNKSSLDEFSYVSRAHYYCPTCKKSRQQAAVPPPPLTAEQKYADLEKKYADLQKRYEEMDAQFRKKVIESASHERMYTLVNQAYQRIVLENEELKEQLEHIENTKMYQL